MGHSVYIVLKGCIRVIALILFSGGECSRSCRSLAARILGEKCLLNFLFFFIAYYMSKKKWPISFSKLVLKMGHYFLDIQYDWSQLFFKKLFCAFQGRGSGWNLTGYNLRETTGPGSHFREKKPYSDPTFEEKTDPYPKITQILIITNFE